MKICSIGTNIIYTVFFRRILAFQAMVTTQIALLIPQKFANSIIINTAKIRK